MVSVLLVVVFCQRLCFVLHIVTLLVGMVENDISMVENNSLHDVVVIHFLLLLFLCYYLNLFELVIVLPLLSSSVYSNIALFIWWNISR